MGLRKKILNKAKTIFGRESSHAEHLLENNILQSDALIVPGQPLEVGTHPRRLDSPGEGSIEPARAENTGSRDSGVAPTASHSGGERIIKNAGNIPADNRLGVLDLGTQNTDRQDSNDQQDVESSNKIYAIQGINPSTSENRNRSSGAGDDKDGELPVSESGPPSMSPSLSGPMRFDGVTNSAISIGGGSVNVANITHNNPSERIRPGLKLLQKRVATSAFHNSAQRVDPPRCHPDTRVAILKQIYDWIFMDLFVRQMWILWMHGAAGAGKSAIMQSIAELCEQAHIPLASFFFVRTDATRNSMASFIATLVYQLIQNIPQVQEEILGVIESNPLIFDQSLKSQLEKLVIQPLLRLQEHFKTFFVIMIDGLDECIERAHQADLIKLLGIVSRSRTTPVIFLVASRREPQIEAAFVRKEISDLVLTLPLDNSDIEQTSDDIRRFLVDKFTDIKETHLLKNYLPFNWPGPSVVEEIVAKSSGQFIFASVVINYLSSPRANPSTQLDIIRGIRLRNPSSQNPFTHLDALYQHILSQVEVLDKVFDIIAYVLIYGTLYNSTIEIVFLLGAGEIYALFADLTAVILCEPTHREFKFLHASLPDFLLDKSRSEQYHIDLDKYRTKLLCMLLERHSPILDPLWLANDLELAIDQGRKRLVAIMVLLQKVKASEQLRSGLMNFNFIFYNETFLDSKSHDIGSCDILRVLKQLDLDDQGQAYSHVLDIFASEYAKYWPLLEDHEKNYIKRESPDLVICIDQIQTQVI